MNASAKATNATSPAAGRSSSDAGAYSGPGLPPELRERVERIPGVDVTDRSFAELTTLRIGGNPAAVVACRSAEALSEVARILDEAAPLGVEWIVVGGGSNLVVGDGPALRCLVVVLAEDAAGLDGAPGAGEDAGPDAGTNAAPGSAPSAGANVGSNAAPNPASGSSAREAGIHIDPQTGLVRAYAGVEWDRLVAATVDAGLGGLECLSGIPGSVGATPVQNVGAYGAEVSQTLRRVQLHERPGFEHPAPQGEGAPEPLPRLRWVNPRELDLAYRYSNLKFTRRAVVTAVEFQLTTDGLSAPLRFGELARQVGVTSEDAAAGGDAVRRPVAEVREAVLRLRRGKGMVLDAGDHDTWSAGSFFTNPIVEGEEQRDRVIAAVRELVGEDEAASMPVYPAGVAHGGTEAPVDGRPAGVPRFKFSAAWLIERAGFGKGWYVPGNDRASLSTKHTLALTNRGHARSEDIVELARAVRGGVQRAFGVDLEPEPVWLGVQIEDAATH